MGENSIFWPVSPQLCQIVHAVAQCLSRLKIVHALQPMNREGFQHQYILQLSPFTLHLKTTNSSGFPAIEMVTNLIFFFFFAKHMSPLSPPPTSGASFAQQNQMDAHPGIYSTLYYERAAFKRYYFLFFSKCSIHIWTCMWLYIGSWYHL